MFFFLYRIRFHLYLWFHSTNGMPWSGHNTRKKNLFLFIYRQRKYCVKYNEKYYQQQLINWKYIIWKKKLQQCARHWAIENTNWHEFRLLFLSLLLCLCMILSEQIPCACLSPFCSLVLFHSSQYHWWQKTKAAKALYKKNCINVDLLRMHKIWYENCKYTLCKKKKQQTNKQFVFIQIYIFSRHNWWISSQHLISPKTG